MQICFDQRCYYFALSSYADDSIWLFVLGHFFFSFSFFFFTNTRLDRDSSPTCDTAWRSSSKRRCNKDNYISIRDSDVSFDCTLARVIMIGYIIAVSFYTCRIPLVFAALSNLPHLALIRVVTNWKSKKSRIKSEKLKTTEGKNRGILQDFLENKNSWL